MTSIDHNHRRAAAALKHYAWLAVILVPFTTIWLTDYNIDRLPQYHWTWRVQRAQSIESEATDIGALPTEGWNDVVLPHRFANPPHSSISAWYRITAVSNDLVRDIWAVYISRPNAGYTIYINGQYIGANDARDRGVPMNFTPLIYRFPGTLLRPGSNEILIRVRPMEQWTTVHTISIGPERELRPIYEIDYAWEVTVKQITVVCMLTMSLMMAALFKLRARDAAFGCFALALLFWSIHIEIKLTVPPQFLTQQIWNSLQAIAVGGFVISVTYFVHRLIGIQRTRLEHVILWAGLAGTAVLILEPLLLGRPPAVFDRYVWFPSILLIGAYQTWELVRAARRAPNLDTRLFALISWWILIAGIRDSLMGVGLLKSRPEYLTFGVGPVLLVVGFTLLRRFGDAVDVVTRTHQELELRVAKKTKELQEHLVQLKDMEREQALQTERERIMRDMHDGIGGQLVQALAMAAKNPKLKLIEHPLRSCLEELRLIIDSIEAVDGDIASALGMLRMRMSRRFIDAGIPLVWNVEDIPPLSDAGPSRVLFVLRIIREAIINALEHSGVTQMTLSTRMAIDGNASAIAIEIAHDGQSYPVVERFSVGIARMKRYAQELNADLNIKSNQNGTVVCLVVPVGMPSTDVSAVT